MSADLTAPRPLGDAGAVPPGRPRAVHAARSRRTAAVRAALLVVFAVFFLVPLLALVEFSTRGIAGAPRTLDGWRQIPEAPGLVDAVVASAQLAALTSVLSLLLLLPTMVWVRLRVPQMSRVVEFLCLLPLTIPAIVLVVGWAPIYLWVDYLSPPSLQGSPLVLVFAYVVLVLPFTYRTLDTGLSAIDVKTLSEAARSLGASWAVVVLRVVAPNVAGALLNAALLSVALVLGEFTVASLLHYDTLQVAMNELSQANARTAVAAAAGSLFFVFLLLMVLQFVQSPRRGRKGGR